MRGKTGMQKLACLRRMSASAAILATALVCSAVGADLRFGGSVEAWGTACPTLSGNASLDLFVGLGSVEAATRTESSLFPYTMGTETLSISLVRDWLSVGGEFQLSVVPIGVTSAMVLSRAQPSPWACSIGDVLLDLSVEGEARLKGDTFATTPLRAEVWVKGTASASRSLGCLDQVLLGASLEATLSAPDYGKIWPTSTLVAALSYGCATLRSETVVSLVPSLRLDEEKLLLLVSWRDLGLSGEASLAFTAEPRSPSVGLRVLYEFGDTPIGGGSSGSECAGGVCR
ncbi:MAG: hypothetical protein NTX69_03800 [Candidatus Bipolaricaulota bacterium]|nr:hypothetical protein [Candidatus Bipolaricaulota bacterium]